MLTYIKDSKRSKRNADLYRINGGGRSMSALDLIKTLRSRLDAIDQRAHEEIQQVIESKGGWFGPLGVLAAIWAIITRARDDSRWLVSRRCRASNWRSRQCESCGRCAHEFRPAGKPPVARGLPTRVGPMPPAEPGQFRIVDGG